jgi:hypothetical protein
MSFESIKAILDARAYGSLIGVEEDAWFEAKGRNPYDFGTPDGRYELGKDVSSFANAEGGFLVIGLTTTIVLGAKTERVSAHDLCIQAEFDAVQYQGLIKDYVHPAIRGLKVDWVPVNDQATHGLGVIEVPVQSPNHKYFLTARVVESGIQVKQIVFGIAKRNESANDPFNIADLHKQIQSGKNPVPQTLARLEQKLDGFIQSQTRPLATVPPGELYAARAARILDEES